MYYCSSHRVANFFSPFSPFSNFSIGDMIRGTVLSPVVGCAPLPLCLSDSGKASQETSISCFCQQTSLALTTLSGFGDSIRDGSLGGAVYGYPFLQFLLHTLSPYCSHAYFVPLLRRTEAPTLWPSFFLSFIWSGHSILGVLKIWANIHLSMGTYYVCSFMIELPHSGYFLVPTICLRIS